MSSRATPRNIDRVHVLGAGGVGLSAVALLARELRIAVTGSDLRDSPIVERVRAAGCEVRLEPWPQAAAAAQWFVAPAGLGAHHPEIAAAADAGVERLSRDEALARLLGDTPCIAVVGTLTRSAAALALAQLLGGAAAGIGHAVGALPRVPAAPHARLPRPGQPMVLELDERAPLPPLENLVGLVVSDLLGPACGYEPRAFPAARRALTDAARQQGAWCILPLAGERDDDPTMVWQHLDGEGRSGQALRARPGLDTGAELVVGLDRDPTLRIEGLTGLVQARALGAALAGAVLGCGLALEPLVTQLGCDTTLRDALEVSGQCDVVARDPVIVHDVRTWPVAISVLTHDSSLLGNAPYVLIRPFPPSFNASHDDDHVRAFSGAQGVLVLPPYPGGRGDEDARLAALLGSCTPVVRIADEDAALARARALHTENPSPWLCLGGDDIAHLARRLAAALETP